MIQKLIFKPRSAKNLSYEGSKSDILVVQGAKEFVFFTSKKNILQSCNLCSQSF